MDENRVPEETTPAPDPVPEQDTAAPPRRLTAVQARKRYGIRLAIFLALFCWFTYDGWHNPKFQKPEKRFDMWFNRIGAYILAAGSLYHGAMFVSAALTVKRQRETGEPDSSADGGPPSATT